MLDLGGGPGTYAIHFAQKWPDLRAVVFDLPDVVAIAAKNVAEAGVSDRVTVQGGNYHKDEFGHSNYDVVFISGTLHQESPDMCRSILSKSYAALKPGGRIIVQDMFIDESGVRPRWPVLLSINMMLFQEGGRSYTVAETVAFLEETGFSNCDHKAMSALNVNSLVLADKM